MGGQHITLPLPWPWMRCLWKRRRRRKSSWREGELLHVRRRRAWGRLTLWKVPSIITSLRSRVALQRRALLGGVRMGLLMLVVEIGVGRATQGTVRIPLKHSKLLCLGRNGRCTRSSCAHRARKVAGSSPCTRYATRCFVHCACRRRRVVVVVCSWKRLVRFEVRYRDDN